jgi:hypothetical protein
MLPFGVSIPATVPQGSEIPEGLMNNPVYIYIYISTRNQKLPELLKEYILEHSYKFETLLHNNGFVIFIN